MEFANSNSQIDPGCQDIITHWVVETWGRAARSGPPAIPIASDRQSCLRVALQSVVQLPSNDSMACSSSFSTGRA